MKRIFVTIMILLILLTGCQKTKSLDTLIKEHQEKPDDIELAIALIDTLMQENKKQDAYEILCEVKEKELSDEQLAKLKEAAKNLAIRLYEIDTYQNGNKTNTNEIRYDEQGRIILKDNEYRIYVDDGDTYYFLYRKAFDGTTSTVYYDRHENAFKEVFSGGDYYRYDLVYENDNLVKRDPYYINNDYFKHIRTETMSYDDKGNVIKVHNESEDLGLSVSYWDKVMKYDNHNNIIEESISYNGKEPSIVTYENEYDKDNHLVKVTITSGISKGDVKEYDYDKIYGVLLKAKEDGNEYIYKYELVEFSNSIGVKEGDIPQVTGETKQQLTKRKVTADVIKIRNTPTTNADNKVGKVGKDILLKSMKQDLLKDILGTTLVKINGLLMMELGLNLSIKINSI